MKGGGRGLFSRKSTMPTFSWRGWRIS